ncbi:uncharacterized protein LOC123658688 [Melitaea cinxia]|uniref:uncharacterized protein LOC123658686 n=1 Tax=Melitaea cinxia TaxID=113334 RepID=UPI001E26FC13|nr:uncharacterized protein LOC123658686 [Melitaea cinxia]XP_045449998.1 uncharacterized protein LOC123658688 [Melitaea cinxia]
MSYLARRKSKPGFKRCTETNYTVSNLPSLRRKRTIAYNRITKALEVGKLIETDASQTELFLSYCQEIKNIADSFQEAHFIILDLLNEEADDVDTEIQENFDEMYFRVVAIQRKYQQGSSQELNNARRDSFMGAQSNMRLPKISLPVFSGAIKEWPEFIATYDALIHQSTILSDIEKFHYLVSVLRGDALSLIRTFPVAGEHYISAYDALKSRYEDKRELAFACWRDILEVNFKTSHAQDFRHALNTIDENLTILKKLKLPTEHWDFVLCYNILSKLDTKLRREFEERHIDIELPQYQHIRAFLHSKSEALIRDTHFSAVTTKTSQISKEASGAFQKSKRPTVTHSLVAPTADMPKKKVGDKQESKPTRVATTSKLIRKCSYCSAEHHITACKDFLSKSGDERMAVAGERKWCYNCLNSSHSVRECTSIFSCRKCHRKHHTLLHRDQVGNDPNTARDHSQSVALVAKKSFTSSNPSANTTVLLATAMVQIRDTSGEFHTFRALFDTGSQNNFLTAHAAKRLGLKPRAVCAEVHGLGGAPASVNGVVTCDLGTNDNVKFHLEMLVIPNICGDQPIARLNTDGWNDVKTLPLADPGFDIPGPIDVLLNADVFAESLLEQRLKGNGSRPQALNSVFGWLLLGKSRLASSPSCLMGLAPPSMDESLNKIVQRFWEIDNVPQSSRLTPDEQVCENIFTNNHYRDETGRYHVVLPFKNNSEPLFEGSRAIALRRFHAIEKRLSRDQSLKQQYTDFMTDYIESGHMTLVPAKHMGLGKYYIPHHCVLRPDSSTTKLRVVFDASAKDANSKSLNDSQLVGPKLQSNIVEILLHYREHKVVFMADVRQMYRQINVAPHHREYQRIFWRAHPDEPLQEYILNTVTYGVSSSPFLACRTIQQLANDEGHHYPKAKAVLTSDIYIDDIVTGSSTLEDACDIKSQVIALLTRGRFELRKWVSNRPELLSDLPSEACLSEAITFNQAEDTTVKVLGLKWEPGSDSCVFNVQPSNQPCTKRTILSEVARVFDPLGFLSPLIIQAKCLIQKLWILGVSWDDTPPPEIVAQWNNFSQQLPQIRELKVPRGFVIEGAQSYQLHGFCDSSELAYGAVIYLRVTESDGSIRLFLVCARARVAPLKRQSLPRLELCAAVLLADLMKFVKETLRIPIHNTYLWSDSTVTLAWLRSPSSRWVTFVANRVSHIQDTVPTECWRHVPSATNSADICSRGQLPTELLTNTLWWAGPEWLSQPPSEWPTDISKCQTQEDVVIPEQRSTVLIANETETTSKTSIIDHLFEKYSSLDKICRILAYIRRFRVNSCVDGPRPESLVVTDVECHRALLMIVKHFQNRFFFDVISNLRLRKQLPRNFRKLNPFLDDQGILRVGGRLARSGLEFEHKHPALLPRKCVLTTAVIESIHRKNLHPGLNTTHYLILQQFWILAAKRAVRQHLSKCIRCYRLRPQPLQPFMSDLPAFRVNQAKAFSQVGVDFAGPFRIKLGIHRGAKIDKAYLCLFVCLSTKAAHLEVVSTLSTDGFIAALRRFVSRRGRCNVIHSDCGTNFVGAASQLASCMEQATNSERIAFKRNPPSSPHFGGVWEIQVKAAKSHLYRIVGDQTLTFEELTTLFTQIESILNSRPLCPLSSDPNDLNVLTPGHFLTLEPLTAVPDPDYSNVNLNRLSRWQLIQSFQQQFWKRWKHEYLHALTQRAKWTKDSKQLTVNSIVLIKDDNRPPLQWALGRVVSLHPGPDGVIRVATLKTRDHIIKRPLVKLCPLPTE